MSAPRSVEFDKYVGMFLNEGCVVGIVENHDLRVGHGDEGQQKECDQNFHIFILYFTR